MLDMRKAEDTLQDVRERFKISDLDEHSYPHPITQRLIRLEKQRDDCGLELAQQQTRISNLEQDSAPSDKIKGAQDQLIILSAKHEKLNAMAEEAQIQQRDLDMAKSLYKQRLEVRDERRRTLDSIKAKIEKMRLEYSGIGLSPSLSTSASRSSRTRKKSAPTRSTKTTKPDSEEKALIKAVGER